MLKVAISSDQTRQFKTTLARLLQKMLEQEGIKSEVVVDTNRITVSDFLNNIDGLTAYSQDNPILIEEKSCSE